MTSKLKKLLANPYIAYNVAAGAGLTNWVSDKAHLKLMYRATLGKWPDLEHPKTFNEKLQWLKLHDRNPLYTTLVDKYLVKQWVADKIGPEYVTKTYAFWERAEDIDITALPERFVLKTNHDSGGVAICRDRATFDLEAAKRKLAKHLKTNYFWRTREWPYKDVKPLVFAEEYLEPDPTVNDLVDYKTMCFDGAARCVFTCKGRGEGDLRVDFYDLNWNHLPFTRHYPNADAPEPRPAGLDKMIALSEKLSEGIPFVRSDFYEVAGHLYFGELTFYPGSGFEEFDPEAWDEELGSWIKLPSGGGWFLVNHETALWLRPEELTSAMNNDDLPDYKLFHFGNGRVITLAMTDRFTGAGLTKTFFDEQWRPLGLSEGGHPGKLDMSEPKNFALMKSLADSLADGFPFARVDFYESGNRLFFGEMTFYPNSGFEHFDPPEWDERFGDWIDLRTAYED